MNWDALGAVAEFVGAIAVVASLAYVAIQIRRNTRTVRAAATKDAASTMRDWFSVVLADPEMARVFATGVEGMARLDEKDRVRFALMMFNFLKAIEEIHYQAHQGLMDQDLWNGWDYQASQYLSAPGVREYWSERRLAFSERFRVYVESRQPDEFFRRVRGLAGSSENEALDQGAAT